MVSIHNIRSIARYETKTLLRSWFFRIFAIISMVFLFFFNFGVLTQANGGAGEWSIKGLPSNIPYANLLFLNVVQAVIAIFLASDFLKRDKKLDTTEVIYMRPMTNGEYVIGKTIGNLSVFFVLNIIIMLIALIFNFIAKNTDVNWISYLYYFLVISVPTLIFIMGLSFVVMSLIKNQAVTFVVMLGYVAISLFYLKDKFYYLFDYMAFNIPLAYSDFVGFGNLETILTHRGMYFGFGVAFILYSIILLKRLAHSELMRWVAAILGTICFAGSLYLGYSHVSKVLNDQDMRTEMISLNDEYKEVKQLQVRSYTIELDHQEDQIKCEANLAVRNRSSEDIDRVVFSLNPGLKLTSITVNGENQEFNQQLGIVELTGLTIKSRDRARIQFRYSGDINESACYLDIDDETRTEAFRNVMYQIDKRHAFITPEYLLLTREANWYPISGVGYGNINKQWFSRQFSDYTLKVKTSPGLTPISQGEMEMEDDQFVFTSSHNQTQVSLSIGKYEQKQTDIDGLKFNLYHLEGHDYFSEFFEDIKDTIPDILTEALQDFERTVDLFYPFDQFSLVEVPIQFFSYERILTGAREHTQPEMLLYAEKGITTREADFDGRMESRRRYGRGDDENLTTEEKKIKVFQNFLSTFTQEQGRPDFSRTKGELTIEEKVNPYFAFPLFYNHAYYIQSDEWPVTDRVFEAYKKQSTTVQQMGFVRDLQGMSDDEKGNLALLSQSFKEILNDPTKNQIVDNVIKQKGKALFSVVKRKAEDEAFEDFLYTYLSDVKFKTSTIEDFNDALKDEFDIDLIPYMKDWFSSTELPAFLIGGVEAVNVLDGDELKTMVKFKVTNSENAEGVISVDFRIGGGRGRFGGGGSPEIITKLVHLEGNQTKEVSFLLSENPRGAGINTLTSRNIPSEIRMPFDNLVEDKNAIPFEGEKIVDDPVRVVEDNEIILDNEDPGFEVSSFNDVSLLRQLILPEDTLKEKYSGFSGWRSPRTWTLTTHSSFYGAYIRSAHYIRSGDGNQKASWKIPVDEGGLYEVYAYVYKDNSRGRRGGGSNGEYHYTINHEDGSEDANVDLKSAEAGWNYLGAYYFSSDTAVIELSNESESRFIVADAIKLIKQ